MRLYVGNLPYTTDDSALRSMFTSYGEVRDAKVVMDRDSGRSRGFGFVELDDGHARAAIAAMDGQEFEGRRLVVNEAAERKPRPGGGGGGGGGGYGGGGGGRGGRPGGGGGGYSGGGGGGPRRGSAGGGRDSSRDAGGRDGWRDRGRGRGWDQNPEE